MREMAKPYTYKGHKLYYSTERELDKIQRVIDKILAGKCLTRKEKRVLTHAPLCGASETVHGVMARKPVRSDRSSKTSRSIKIVRGGDCIPR
jgi:hypothetical protein